MCDKHECCRVGRGCGIHTHRRIVHRVHLAKHGHVDVWSLHATDRTADTRFILGKLNQMPHGMRNNVKLFFVRVWGERVRALVCVRVCTNLVRLSTADNIRSSNNWHTWTQYLFYFDAHPGFYMRRFINILPSDLMSCVCVCVYCRLFFPDIYDSQYQSTAYTYSLRDCKRSEQPPTCIWHGK